MIKIYVERTRFGLSVLTRVFLGGPIALSVDSWAENDGSCINSSTDVDFIGGEWRCLNRDMKAMARWERIKGAV